MSFCIRIIEGLTITRPTHETIFVQINTQEFFFKFLVLTVLAKWERFYKHNLRNLSQQHCKFLVLMAES